MMKAVILSFMLGVFSLCLSAQALNQPAAKLNKCSCGFQSILQGGLVEGNAGPSWSIQAVNGVYYKSWFGGVGVGIDYYMMRTVPLFIDIRKDLFKRAKTPFLYADAGIHFDWLKSKEKPFWGSSDYNRGLYYDVGGGYKITLKAANALFVSAGYSLKRLSEERTTTPQCIQAPCDPSKEYYKYNFKRLSFKVGWQFR
jgi:hypothetical protein